MTLSGDQDEVFKYLFLQSLLLMAYFRKSNGQKPFFFLFQHLTFMIWLLCILKLFHFGEGRNTFNQWFVTLNVPVYSYKVHYITEYRNADHYESNGQKKKKRWVKYIDVNLHLRKYFSFNPMRRTVRQTASVSVTVNFSNQLKQLSECHVNHVNTSSGASILTVSWLAH